MKKLFTRLAGAVMTVGCLACPSAMDAATVYFNADGVSGDIYAYAFNSSTEVNTGIMRAQNIANKIWGINFDDTYDKVIFLNGNDWGNNNSNKRTGDLSVVNGHVYANAASDGNEGVMYSIGVYGDGVANSKSWSASSMVSLTSAATAPFEFTGEFTTSGSESDSNKNFRIYDQSASQEYEPANGTYTAANLQGSNAMRGGKEQSWYTTGGTTYKITVNVKDKTFTISKKGDGGDTPSTGKIFLVTSRPGNGNGATDKQLFAMEESSENVYEYTVTDYAGQDIYLYVQEKDDNGNVIKTYGSTNTSHGNSGMDNREDIQKGNSKGMIPHTGDVDAGYKYNNSGEIRIRVNFNNNPATFEILGDVVDPSKVEYYFIGDMNQWYSKEFTDSEAPKTIDADMLKDNKDKWKFTYDEVNNWYTFSCDLLAGQFQIFDGTSWTSPEVYSNSTLVTANNDNKSDEEREKAFETYLGNKVQVDPSFEIWTKLRRGNGQNLHLPSNAVEDAQILFKPAVLDENGDVKEEGQIAIIGTPVNYYIFYDRSGDKDRNVESDPLRAHINSDNPNKNNYYIPFNTVNIDGKDHDFKNVQIDGQTDYNHMNYTEGNDYNRNGYKMLRAKFYKDDGENVTWLTEQEILELLPDASDDVVESLKKGMLPNGISVMDREIWYAKVPNGFACPAGAKFTVAFRNSLDDESYRDPATKTPYWTALGTFNLYFFDPIHIHVNSEDVDILDYVDNVKISYRIYTYDKDYNTVVVDPNDDQKFLDEKLATRGNVPTEKANTTVGGWVELGTKHIEHSKWNVMEELILNKNQWRIKEEAATRATTQTEVNRKKISAGLTNAYVQYKFTYTPKEGETQPSHIQFNQAFDVYLPKVATMGRNADEQKLNGNDRYLVLNPYDETYTGIDNIFEDFGDDAFDGEDATPVYYNLQGVRVVNPTKGLYIKVTGSKSEKVLF